MKATFDIPDDLYRNLEAKSAREGRSASSIATEILEKGVETDKSSSQIPEDRLTEEDYAKYPWLKISQKYIKSGMSHDWDEIKEAIAIGWGKEAGEKLKVQEESW